MNLDEERKSEDRERDPWKEGEKLVVTLEGEDDERRHSLDGKNGYPPH